MKLPASTSVRVLSLPRRLSLARAPFDVLRQQFVVEGLADVASPEGADGLVEEGEDAGVVRGFGHAGRGGLGGQPVGEGGDGLPGDREVFEVGLGLPQSTLQFADLRAEFVGQGSGGFFLEAERVEQGLDVHAVTASASRQVGMLAPRPAGSDQPLPCAHQRSPGHLGNRPPCLQKFRNDPEPDI